MILKRNFDPCHSIRTRSERCYRRGLLREAIALSRRIDAAQLCAWQTEAITPKEKEALPALRPICR